MRITEVKTWIVSVPFRFPETWRDGQRSGINNVVIRLATDEGLEGWGEASSNSGGSVEVTDAIVRSFIPFLVGVDPHQIEGTVARFYGAARWGHHRVAANAALAGVEMAMWDLVGKAANQPVSSLIGGALRESVSAYGNVTHDDDPQAMADAARRWVDAGHDVIYVNAGQGLERDVAVVEAIRGAIGPDVRLRVDAGEAWTVAEAVNTIRRLEEFRLDFVEQPVRADDLDGMALLRRRLATPIAANQSTWTVQNVYNVVAHGAADVVVIGLHWLGGILAFRKAAAIAEAANIPVCRHSSGELGVATAAGLQVLAVVPNQVDGHQTYYSHLADDIIVGDEVHLHGGRQTVPTAPGLGVTVDPDKLKQYSRAYSDNGPYRAYSLDGTQLVSGFGKR